MTGGMIDFLVIAGLSGAGRSTAAATFEDLGWFVIDNLPPSLISKVAELVDRPGSDTDRVALVLGRGGEEYVEDVGPALQHLRATGNRVRVLYLEASDEVLVQRFEGTRRRHPLAAEGVIESIARERDLLDPIRIEADVVVDTSDLNVHQLRDRLVSLFETGDPAGGMQTQIVSFGYKFGIPRDVDLVLDCRFLPNPHWIEELRPHSGLEAPVRDYVMSQPDTAEFLDRLGSLLDLLLPGYVKEGKSYLSIAVGCTGGHHRSVVLAEEIGSILRSHGFDPAVSHRDVMR
ncbi:MAG TPA: RNase adapter RapZ [Acidimicrobiales bacterium]|nr:RNase adapter RapZ [Acidimicrobiales bacterium]